MIFNYFRIAWRNAVKNKVFSFINIFGLAVGLSCCMLITMYLLNEFSYDQHQEKRSRLYQVGSNFVEEGVSRRSATTPAPLGPYIQQDYPEIESMTRMLKLFQDDKTLLQYQNNGQSRSFYETQGYMVDSTFFKMFSYHFTEGDPATALDKPNSAVISEEIAKKVFGTESALNKTLHINSNTNGEFDYVITGVFRPSITPSHIDARYFLSMQSGEVGPWVREMTNIVNNNLFYTYLLLKQGTDAAKLETKLRQVVQKYAAEDLKASGRSLTHFLTPVNDIHLRSDAEGNVTPNGNPGYLYILLSIALVTLLIACVNFMNLSTARSSKRAIEIGVRKVLGAEKRSLVKQFLFEALLLAFLSYLVAIGITAWLKPVFEKMAGKEFIYSNVQYALMLAGFFLVSVMAGLIAGIYPAFYLAAFKPIKVLKGKFSNSLGAISFRKVLVVFQFMISVALIVASITIAGQMRYMRNKNLGFQKEKQVVIPLRTTAARNMYASFKNELTKSTAISGAGASAYYPGIENVTDWLLYKQGDAPSDLKTMFMNFVDADYLQTMGIQTVAGRLFSPEFPGDTANSIVLNEQALRDFGFSSARDAIGKNIAATRNNQEVLFPIVGVVKDFHFKGLHSKIQSYGFLLRPNRPFGYVIAHAKDNIRQALSDAGAAWKKLNPNEPFDYSFLDDDFQKNYVAEERLATIIRYFTIIAIFISCLGLFGLTTFSIELRTREIGIRKVLGSSTAGIVSLLSKDFLRLVLISFLVASPLAWYFINKWLQGFAYRVPFTIGMVVMGCILTMIIAFLTISIQAVRAGLANPVKNLRTE